jgi:glycosyltransferase involved in cell wall biosynthesis
MESGTGVAQRASTRPHGQPNLHITVIIPTHNRPELLKQCLASLSDQDYSYFDVIVADTGSSGQPTESAQRSYPLRIIKVARNSLASAYNAGISNASSSVICFLDDDVTMPANWLRSLVELILQNPAAAAWAGPVVELGPRRTRQVLKSNTRLARIGFRVYDALLMAGLASKPAEIASSGAVSFGRVKPLENADSEDIAFRVTAPSNANLAVRREVLLDLGGFDERFDFSYQEGDFYLRLRHANLPIMMGRKPYLFHHISGGGDTRRIEPHSRDFEVYLEIIQSRSAPGSLIVAHWVFRLAFIVTFLLTSPDEMPTALREILRGLWRGHREFSPTPRLPLVSGQPGGVRNPL